jgi:hypothetical protein
MILFDSTSESRLKIVAKSTFQPESGVIRDWKGSPGGLLLRSRAMLLVA